MNIPLWEPTSEDIQRSNLHRFMEAVEERYGVVLTDYWKLDQWSNDYPEEFWSLVWDFCGIVGKEKGARVSVGSGISGVKWFPDAKLNFAENMLRRRDEATALVFWGEDKIKRRISYKELYDAVSRLAQALRASGVRPGDRVAGYIPNMPEAVMLMLATTSIGAVWSSCSPDFGVNGALSRFSQIEPVVLVAADGYYHNGAAYNVLDRLAEITEKLPTVRTVVVVPYIGTARTYDIQGGISLDAFVARYTPAEIEFEQLPFDHPVYILFSSGTTGAPKCIVHGAGGTLLQHCKEHVLHVDIHAGDRLFYQTTCGWMMWNWLVSGLASGATLLLYDGSPLYNKGRILFEYAEQEGMTVFGTSAKYIDALIKLGYSPRNHHHLGELKVVLSTGSPLTPAGYEYVYKHIKSTIRLSSISGGTDIVSCFLVGNPLLLVWSGEMQCRGLGLAVEVYNEKAESVVGEKGELVCIKPFPCMPIGFWNDKDGFKYRAAYFEAFPGVWTHGDYAMRTQRGGFVIYGRSDATLNPGGVRIGTAEIYREVEKLPEVVESLAVGQEYRGDVRTVLFVKLRDGSVLDDSLKASIKKQLLSAATAYHVPSKIIQVMDIPRTKSGKIVELAVRDIINNKPVRNTDALANPEALEQFKNIQELS